MHKSHLECEHCTESYEEVQYFKPLGARLCEACAMEEFARIDVEEKEALRLGLIKYIPETPGGTALGHLAADTEDQAWLNLLEDAKHMPYKGKPGFIERGYSVDAWRVTPDPDDLREADPLADSTGKTKIQG